MKNFRIYFPTKSHLEDASYNFDGNGRRNINENYNIRMLGIFNSYLSLKTNPSSTMVGIVCCGFIYIIKEKIITTLWHIINIILQVYTIFNVTSCTCLYSGFCVSPLPGFVKIGLSWTSRIFAINCTVLHGGLHES